MNKLLEVPTDVVEKLREHIHRPRYTIQIGREEHVELLAIIDAQQKEIHMLEAIIKIRNQKCAT
jgi:hypothetical protein